MKINKTLRYFLIIIGALFLVFLWLNMPKKSETHAHKSGTNPATPTALDTSPKSAPHTTTSNPNAAINEQANQLLKQGNYEAALQIFQKLTLEQPQNPSAWYNVGVCYNKIGNYEQAASSFEKVLSLPQKAEFKENINYSLGVVYKSLNKLDLALAHLEKAIEQDPKNKKPYFEAAIILDKQKNYDKALNYYATFITLDPNNAMVYFNMGNTYLHKNEIDNAINTYEKAIQADPAYAKPYANLGNCYRKKGDEKKAQTYFLKAIALDPTLGK